MFNLLFCVGVMDVTEPPAWWVWGCAESRFHNMHLHPCTKIGAKQGRGRYQLSHTWDSTLTSLTPTINGVNVSQQ
ncbi:hypothetical protein DPMN_007415 [Dreissena polymorpha]|uniref:Uncharacterized protein n=1 Tax=Dreissena polymorpha TaxID=45954 RepID=A0A9D4MTL9_DREPO|nr:hypothetical protein DPMN_007415 [Dreissena polymorpha]